MSDKMLVVRKRDVVETAGEGDVGASAVPRLRVLFTGKARPVRCGAAFASLCGHQDVSGTQFASMANVIYRTESRMP